MSRDEGNEAKGSEEDDELHSDDWNNDLFKKKTMYIYDNCHSIQ